MKGKTPAKTFSTQFHLHHVTNGATFQDLNCTCYLLLLTKKYLLWNPIHKKSVIWNVWFSEIFCKIEWSNFFSPVTCLSFNRNISHSFLRSTYFLLLKTRFFLSLSFLSAFELIDSLIWLIHQPGLVYLSKHELVEILLTACN